VGAGTSSSDTGGVAATAHGRQPSRDALACVGWPLPGVPGCQLNQLNHFHRFRPVKERKQGRGLVTCHSVFQCFMRIAQHIHAIQQQPSYPEDDQLPS
jgi:hypothetical protein